MSIENPKYTMVTVNIVTATTRKSRTYYINVENIPASPPLNTMRESQLTQISDYVTEGVNLVKCREDINELLIRGIVLTTPVKPTDVDTIPASKPLTDSTSTQRSLINLRDELLKTTVDSTNLLNPMVQILCKINSCLYSKY